MNISALDIVVHKISSPGGRWIVSLIDTVANNHQVNIGQYNANISQLYSLPDLPQQATCVGGFSSGNRVASLQSRVWHLGKV